MPSIPLQLKVTCGKRLVSHHEILLVMKVSSPASAMIWGRDAGNPKVSGRYRCRWSADAPKRSDHQLVPCDLAYQGFTGWHVAIGLDPHGPAGFPSTIMDAVPDLTEEFEQSSSIQAYCCV